MLVRRMVARWRARRAFSKLMRRVRRSSAEAPAPAFISNHIVISQPGAAVEVTRLELSGYSGRLPPATAGAVAGGVETKSAAK